MTVQVYLQWGMQVQIKKPKLASDQRHVCSDLVHY
jgi:hypothetical protein